MESVGQKVAKLRRELHLSQQQLAGDEMDRSLISQIETGRCNPSPENLRVIAQRLGKPFDYFLTKDQDDTLPVALALVESAERDLSAGHDQALAAQGKCTKAISMIVGLGAGALEGRARLGLIRALQMQRKYEEVLKEGPVALEVLSGNEERHLRATVHWEMGRAAFLLEDFSIAHVHFERAALYVSGLKKHMAMEAESLMFLGSSLFRLGRYNEALASYHKALEACEMMDSPVLRGSICMGLGWTLHCSGQESAAYEWTSKALQLLKKAGSASHILAKHNLAIIDMARGNWEKAYISLNECLAAYEAQGSTVKQAGILEELAQYWLQRNDPSRAETLVWRALELLETKGGSVLKGRLYRLLGLISYEQGATVQARAFLRMSVDLLNCLRSYAEANISLAEYNRIHAKIEAKPAR